MLIKPFPWTQEEVSQMDNLAQVDYLIVHHTVTGDVSAEQINKGHKANGWIGIGYHYLIRADGSIEKGRPDNKMGAQAQGFNDRSLGIALAGNFTDIVPSDAQKKSLVELLANLKQAYPNAKVVRHSDLMATACPGASFPWDEVVQSLANPTGTPATGQPTATLAQAREFLRQKAPDWVMMADLYYSIAPRYNIRPDVALSQACKETGYFRFGGAVTPEHNNFCGLKISSANGDKPSDHATFIDRATGVEAHIQHLAAYFTTDEILGLLDPRFNIVVKVHGRGQLRYVEQLGGKWAPNPDYGNSIARDYLDKLLVTVAPAEPVADPCANCQKCNDLLIEKSKLFAEVSKLRQIINQAAGVLAVMK